jgi:hypothetical protein
MPTPLDDVCCAQVPAAGLAALASARCLPQIGVIADGERYWLRWDEANDRILRLILPLPGVELFSRRGNHWTQPGRRLPCVGPPEDLPVKSLDHILFPAPVRPISASAESVQPCQLRLVADDRPRPATALRCPLAALARWAEEATTKQIASVRAAQDGKQAFLVGARLPLLPGNERFWGERVFVRLGMRPEPALSANALIQLLSLQNGEVAVLDNAGLEVLPADAFAPLTRSGIRRACGEEVP